ncbi:MAG: hypothetical protein AAF802_06390 [Planctomycetota bacterium]
MKFLIPATMTLITLATTVPASAQFSNWQITIGRPPISAGLSHTSRLISTPLPQCTTAPRQPVVSFRPDLSRDFRLDRPDLLLLDRLADQLELAARHLHEDAIRLGQDYVHSPRLSFYVSRLDRLNGHLHDMIHRATDRGFLSEYEARYVSRDVQEIRLLATRLDAELLRQRRNGAQPCHFAAIDHMRDVLSLEIFAAIREMEHQLSPRRASFRSGF